VVERKDPKLKKRRMEGQSKPEKKGGAGGRLEITGNTKRGKKKNHEMIVKNWLVKKSETVGPKKEKTIVAKIRLWEIQKHGTGTGTLPVGRNLYTSEKAGI